MKFITILFSIFTLNSCGNSKATTNMQENTDAKQTQILTGKYLISSLVAMDELPADTHLSFDETTNRVSGYAGCNRFSGNYTVEGNHIEFTNIIATRMYCKETMTAEQNVINALEKATTFTIANNELTLNNENEILVQATKNVSTKIAKEEDYSIEYTAVTRGTFINIVVKNDSITFQKNRGTKPETRTFNTQEKNTIYAKVNEVNVKELPSLEAPSKAHQYDGAAGAILTIVKNGQTYKTQTFDHGQPHTKIEDLVSTILSMTEKQ
ncbi:META domain-containing protein [Lacinutrix sp. C3R15]|uniref:META domain-containing protein n=1 Tax=Flavobacteriaceae TaxID=49546 RepID=UPI001C08B109|nr:MULTISPECIES: META domain-containing protein [Flavobacteriaceae]MBU2940873.1 META domain-containing protein [Lacinutrix sp. C3R15]MDO6624192.1 META domain-containing protein [Oceanihabitans sp. 1_MG-2023]